MSYYQFTNLKLSAQKLCEAYQINPTLLKEQCSVDEYCLNLKEEVEQLIKAFENQTQPTLCSKILEEAEILNTMLNLELEQITKNK